jgi:hypothetical protein
MIRIHRRLRNRQVVNRNPRLVNRLRVAGDQGMPPFQSSSVRQNAIGAGFWQPFYSPDIIRCQSDAVRNQLAPVAVVGTSASFNVQKITGHPGIMDAAGFPVFELLEAAATASVTERFPLRSGHIMQRRGYPKGGIASGHEAIPLVSVVAFFCVSIISFNKTQISLVIKNNLKF